MFEQRGLFYLFFFDSVGVDEILGRVFVCTWCPAPLARSLAPVGRGAVSRRIRTTPLGGRDWGFGSGQSLVAAVFVYMSDI